MSLRENFDIVLQLFSETFSSPYPVSTDASALAELVPSTNFLNKIFTAGLVAASNATGGNSGSAPAGYAGPANYSTSPLHWRRAGIRYAQNEVYFDINEDIKAVLDK